jgi:hypothetical protein
VASTIKRFFEEKEQTLLQSMIDCYVYLLKSGERGCVQFSLDQGKRRRADHRHGHGKWREGNPLLTCEGFLIGERNSASAVAAQKFSVWQSSGQWAVASTVVADLQNFPGRIGGSGPNGSDLAAPGYELSDGNVLRRYLCAEQPLLPFFNRIRSTYSSLSLISLLAEAIGSTFPPLSVSFLDHLAELDPLSDQSPKLSCLR